MLKHKKWTITQKSKTEQITEFDGHRNNGTGEYTTRAWFEAVHSTSYEKITSTDLTKLVAAIDESEKNHPKIERFKEKVNKLDEKIDKLKLDRRDLIEAIDRLGGRYEV